MFSSGIEHLLKAQGLHPLPEVIFFNNSVTSLLAYHQTCDKFGTVSMHGSTMWWQLIFSLFIHLDYDPEGS